jgi:hypothetical protein
MENLNIENIKTIFKDFDIIDYKFLIDDVVNKYYKNYKKLKGTKFYTSKEDLRIFLMQKMLKNINKELNIKNYIDIKSKKLIYDQVMEYCKENNIKIKDFYNSIDITDVGFRKTWAKKNPQSIETLIDIINFIDKNKNG